MNQNNDTLKSLLKELYHYCKKQLGFKKPIKIILAHDKKNAEDPLGKTGFFDQQNKSITLYVDGRHIKDILKTMCHEIYHYYQYCNGEFKDIDVNNIQDGYAQKNKKLREIERKAYENGYLMFRDFEDERKKSNK